MEYKIETDLNDETHLVQYNNDDGVVIRTDTLENCKKCLIDLIKHRHRKTNISFSHNRIIDHDNGNKELSCKEFCEF